MHFTCFVIYNRKHSSFMAIDISSGGYLYPVKLEIHHAKLFKSYAEAIHYLEGFKPSNPNYDTYGYNDMGVREVQIKVIN